MVKRHADGSAAVVATACAISSCLDVLPSQLHRAAADQPSSVLGAIENLPGPVNQEPSSRFASNKKQCRLAGGSVDQRGPTTSLFAQARAVLRQPFCAEAQDAPIGREQEFEALSEAFQEFSSSGSGSSIYVSGLPGTGKSHTVRKTLSHLMCSSSAQQQPKCLVTWVNCMSVSSAGEIYAQVAATARSGHSSTTDWHQQQQPTQTSSDDADDALPLYDTQQALAAQQQQQQQSSVSFEALLDCLQQQQQQRHHKRASAHSSRQPSTTTAASSGTKRYRAARDPSSSLTSNTTNSSLVNSSSQQSQQQAPPPHIVVLDEIDNIAKKSLPGLVQLFKLPHEPGASVLVVGIANSIDLTERTLPELKLALVTPRLITFNAYSAKQLGAILEGVMQQMPPKLFSPQALQLVCRSVAASTGDLRHALKACRAAVDELEQQHQQEAAAAAAATAAAVTSAQLVGDGSIGSNGQETAAAAAAAAAGLSVGPRQMSVALARLAGVRSGQFGAQAASIIRSLPNQQQMLLYSLAVFCQQQPAQQGACGQASAAGPDPAMPGSKATASSLWKGAGSALLLSSCAGAGAGGGGKASPGAGSWSAGLKSKKKKAAVHGPGQGGAQAASVFALAVTADAAYHQYMQVCKLLKLPACSKGELLHMADLLAQMALLDIIKAPTGTAGAVGSGSKGGSKAGGGPVAGVRGFRGSGSKLGGLGGGGRGLLGGGASRGGVGGLGGSPMGSAAGAGQQVEVKLSLRASASEVFAALKHNPALRCLVDA